MEGSTLPDSITAQTQVLEIPGVCRQPPLHLTMPRTPAHFEPPSPYLDPAPEIHSGHPV